MADERGQDKGNRLSTSGEERQESTHGQAWLLHETIRAVHNASELRKATDALRLDLDRQARDLAMWRVETNDMLRSARSELSAKLLPFFDALWGNLQDSFCELGWEVDDMPITEAAADYSARQGGEQQ